MKEFVFGNAKIKKDITFCLQLRIYAGNGEWNGDPNQILVDNFNGKLPLIPMEGARCAITNEEAVIYQTETMIVPLRPDILQRMIMLALKKSEHKKLSTLFPDAHELHDDFYSSDGRTLQSKMEYIDPTLLYVPIKEVKKRAEKRKATLKELTEQPMETEVDLS